MATLKNILNLPSISSLPSNPPSSLLPTVTPALSADPVTDSVSFDGALSVQMEQHKMILMQALSHKSKVRLENITFRGI